MAQSSPIGWVHPPNIASHELQKDVSENILLKRGGICDHILHPFILDLMEEKLGDLQQNIHFTISKKALHWKQVATFTDL